uniref:Protein preY, mitochondrial n=1 Tax=Ailuropoda melanoleuca TaxID=9646 RepID=A0A7N5JX12_AILME
LLNILSPPLRPTTQRKRLLSKYYHSLTKQLMGDLPRAFDPVLLKFLLCPLSKKRLRYEALTNELINIELGIAYPIFDGVPNMIPQATRTTHQNKKKKWRRTRSYLKAKT